MRRRSRGDGGDHRVLQEKGPEWDELPGQAHGVSLLEGVPAKVGRKAPKERYSVMFNDLLIYGDGYAKSVAISKIFQMNGLAVHDNPHTEKLHNQFTIIHVSGMFVVFCRDRQRKRLCAPTGALVAKNAEPNELDVEDSLLPQIDCFIIFVLIGLFSSTSTIQTSSSHKTSSRKTSSFDKHHRTKYCHQTIFHV